MIKKIICVLALSLVINTPVNAKELTDTYIAKDIQDVIYEVADDYNICPELIMAIIEYESSGKPTADNGNCKGLMQIYESVHTKRMSKLGVTDLYDPKQNITVGCDLLLELFEEYEDLPVVLMKYNGTPNAVKRGLNGNYTSYCKKVMARSYELEVVHDKAFLLD